MCLAPIQLDVDLIAGLEVKYNGIAGIVVVLVRVLGDGAGSYLQGKKKVKTLEMEMERKYMPLCCLTVKIQLTNEMCHKIKNIKPISANWNVSKLMNGVEMFGTLAPRIAPPPAMA